MEIKLQCVDFDNEDGMWYYPIKTFKVEDITEILTEWCYHYFSIVINNNYPPIRIRGDANEVINDLCNKLGKLKVIELLKKGNYWSDSRSGGYRDYVVECIEKTLK